MRFSLLRSRYGYLRYMLRGSLLVSYRGASPSNAPTFVDLVVHIAKGDRTVYRKLSIDGQKGCIEKARFREQAKRTKLDRPLVHLPRQRSPEGSHESDFVTMPKCHKLSPTITSMARKFARILSWPCHGCLVINFLDHIKALDDALWLPFRSLWILESRQVLYSTAPAQS